jgi:integration host factor subunit beta
MGSATTKQDLVKRVAAQTEQPRNVVRQIVQSLLDGIIDELAQGNRLEFRDFGVFEVVTRRPRVARNPRTGEAIHVPAKTVAHFKQGRVMRTRVAAYGEAQQGTEAPAEPTKSRPDSIADPTGNPVESRDQASGEEASETSPLRSPGPAPGASEPPPRFD